MQQVTSNMAKPRYHIFLSYRREDGKDLARTLKETLVGKGYRVFLGRRSASDGTSSIAPELSPLRGKSAVHRIKKMNSETEKVLFVKIRQNQESTHSAKR